MRGCKQTKPPPMLPSTMLRKGVPQPEGLPITNPYRYIPISCRYRSGWTGHDAGRWHLGKLGAQKLLPGWLHTMYSSVKGHMGAYSFSPDYHHTSPAHDATEHLSGGVAACRCLPRLVHQAAAQKPQTPS